MASHPNASFFYEYLIRSLYTELVRPGDVVVDGGASLGLHTQHLVLLVGEEGRCLAVEALPELAESLSEHYGWRPQFDGLNVALSDAREKLPFYRVTNDLAYSGLRSRPTLANRLGPVHEEVVQVQGEMLDNLLTDYNKRRVSFIKLDLEGGEYCALRGAVETLGAGRPVVVFEQASDEAAEAYGYSEADFFTFFHLLGYDLYTILGIPFKSWKRRDLSYTVGVPKERRDATSFLRHALVWRILRRHWKGLLALKPRPKADLWDSLWL